MSRLNDGNTEAENEQDSRYLSCECCSATFQRDWIDEYMSTPYGYQCMKCYEDCPHDDIDHGECMDCGKDCMDLLIMRADNRYEGDR